MQKAGYSSIEYIIGSRAVLDAELRADANAEPFAVVRAEVFAELRADSGAESGTAPVGRPVYR